MKNGKQMLTVIRALLNSWSGQTIPAQALETYNELVRFVNMEYSENFRELVVADGLGNEGDNDIAIEHFTTYLQLVGE